MQICVFRVGGLILLLGERFFVRMREEDLGVSAAADFAVLLAYIFEVSVGTYICNHGNLKLL